MYSEYCNKMFEIASRMKLETSSIIQYVINSVVDDEMNKIILYSARSTCELKHKFEIHEAIKNRSKHPNLDEQKQKSLRAEDKREDKRCYNCVDQNHLSAACPMKGIKYFKCNEYNHFVAICSNTLKKNRKKREIIILRDSQRIR